MTRGELLNDVRAKLNRLAEELVRDDLLEAAANLLAASMSASQAEHALADAGEDDKPTQAGTPAEEA